MTEAREFAERAAKLLADGEALVRDGVGPGEPSRQSARRRMEERAHVYALTAIAMALTEKKLPEYRR